MSHPLAVTVPPAERSDASALILDSPRADQRLDASWSQLAGVLEVAPASRLRAAPRRHHRPGEVPEQSVIVRVGGMLALLLASLWLGLFADTLIAWLPLVAVLVGWTTWAAGSHQVREVLNDADRPHAERTRVWRGDVDADTT
jgi:hypothetical protein